MCLIETGSVHTEFKKNEEPGNKIWIFVKIARD